MTTPDLIDVSALVAATYYAYAVGSIDNPANIEYSNVYIYSGTEDTVVNPGVVKKAESYYGNWVSSDNIQAVYNISSEHCLPTDSYGNNCSYLGSPFINNCDYDAAGYILNWLLERSLNPKVTANPNSIISIAQNKYIPLNQDRQSVGLQAVAYAYIPIYCANNSQACDIHIAFHGCKQTINCTNSTFYTNTGYNEWAESNNIIILYPQAQENNLNPYGCWDWWGYTGTVYATQLGTQMATTINMVEAILNNSIK